MNDIDNQEAKRVFKTCIADNDVDALRVFLEHMPQYAAWALKLSVKANNMECVTLVLPYCKEQFQEQIDQSLTDAAIENNLTMVEFLLDYISPDFECNGAMFFAAMCDRSDIMDVLWRRGRFNIDNVTASLYTIGATVAVERLERKQSEMQKQHLEEALLITPASIAEKRQRLGDKAILTKKNVIEV